MLDDPEDCVRRLQDSLYIIWCWLLLQCPSRDMENEMLLMYLMTSQNRKHTLRTYIEFAQVTGELCKKFWSEMSSQVHA